MKNWSATERREFLNGLDAIERVLVTAGQVLLGLLIAAIIAGTAFVVVKRPWGAGNQGEWFYFGVAVLLALGWCIGQFTSLAARRCRDDAAADTTVHSDAVDGAQQWTWQFGNATVPHEGSEHAPHEGRLTISHSFQVPMATLAMKVAPEEHALARLSDELVRGASLDEACRSIQPEYETWNGLQRRAYQLFVSSLLEQAAAPRK